MEINLKHIKSVYLIGIGGIGMSALARYFNHNGLYVAGYDSTPTPLTQALQAEGMEIHFTDGVEEIPKRITDNPKDSLVIYTPAIPHDHRELNYLIQKQFTIIKRAQTLGLISTDYSTAAVAGTHGKTSTTTLLAHMLNGTPQGCNAFLGGISKNIKSNLLISNSKRLAVEADEYDRSFHYLNPELAIITSVDADHLDVYSTKSQVLEAFVTFISQIKPNGTLVIKKGLEHLAKDFPGINVFTYSVDQKADFYVSDLELSEGIATFTLHTPNGSIEGLELGIPGKFNVENAVAASAAALAWHIDEAQLRNGLKTFAGVERRVDLRFKSKNTIYIDDYAHHPEELKACITSTREIFPHRKIIGIFQPHLYSRTKNFMDEFAASLSLLDELILLDIYPAREKPIPGITSSGLLERTNIGFKRLCSLENTVDQLKGMDLEVLLTMGAGNISTLVKPIEQMLKERRDGHED